MLHGNLSGLKPADLRSLERLYRRKIPPSAVISSEAARAVTEMSFRLNRQVGLLIERSGRVAYVVVGDARGLFLPDLKGHPLGRKLFRSLRLVHTHIKGEPLSTDDLTDLALLRFDLVAALGVGEGGIPSTIQVGYLNAGKEKRKRIHKVLPPEPFQRFRFDFTAFIEALEEEMRRDLSMPEKEGRGERAILISVDTGPRWKQEDSIEELDELACSSDLNVLERVLQRPSKVDPRHLLGKGKLQELIIMAMQQGATILVFDQNLTPGQGKRIAEATELKVIDRSQLILDIFARRAHSREGKVQVELAQLKYRLPRLTGKGTAMSRLMGGIGGRGPGEMKLEVDRRRVRDRIALLEKQLKSISRARKQRKARRARTGLPIVSLVGYTNAGKSTLLNALTSSDTHVEDKMFATLDTASRRLRFPREKDVIITDTVGFIRDLPRDLFNAFRATLDEMEDADLLVHLVDSSNPRFEQHMGSVNTVIEELGFEGKRVLTVFNKIDLLPDEMVTEVLARYGAVGVSAIRKESFPPLLSALEEALWPSVSPSASTS